MIFGNKIKALRKAKGLLLRQVAAKLDIDTATISKIEKGSRNATKTQVNRLALILEEDINELTALWLADKIYKLIKNEPMAMEAVNKVIVELKK